jgi:hypothetical protein
VAGYIPGAAAESGNLLIGYNVARGWIPNSVLIFLLRPVTEPIFYAYGKGLLLHLPWNPLYMRLADIKLFKSP